MKNDYKAILKHAGFVIILIVVLGSCGKKFEDRKTTVDSSISIAELRDHMYYLASDELEGRMPGERGYDTAADYCATQFRQAGLVPICRDADGKKTFLQKVRIVKRTRGSSNSLWVQKNEEMIPLRYEDDFFYVPESEDKDIRMSGPLVFVGYGIHEPEYGWDDYAGIDVEGKWAVYMFGSPPKSADSGLPEEILKRYADGLEGYQLKGRAAFDAGALGVVVIGNKERFRMWDVLRHARRTSCTLPGHESHFQSPSMEVFLNKEPLDNLFEGLPFNPITGKGIYNSFAMEGMNLVLEAEILVEDIHSANVVAMVEGTDPQLKDEYITIGAHLDHVGHEDGRIFNGADDNASGSVAVLEAAEAVALNPPKRSTLFVLYTGEELKFMGSQYFVLNPPVPLENISININLDMVGRLDGEAKELAVTVAGRTAAELRELVSSLNNSHTRLPLDFGFDKYLMMSDQVSYYLEGIPVVFFHNGDHEDYHKATDDAEKIDFDFLQKSSQLTCLLALELANRD